MMTCAFTIVSDTKKLKFKTCSVTYYSPKKW